MAKKTKEQIKAYLNQCGDLDYNEFIDFIDSVLFEDGGQDIAPICQVMRYKRFRKVNEPIVIHDLFNEDTSLVGLYIKRYNSFDFELTIGTTLNDEEIVNQKIDNSLVTIDSIYIFDRPTSVFIKGFDNDNIADVIVLYNTFVCDDNGEVSMSLIESLQSDIKFLQSNIELLSSNFQKQINTLSNAIIQIPAGVVVQWNGTLTNIPAGWKRYLGNGGLFLIGENTEYLAGSTGGEKEVRLTADQNGPHDHKLIKSIHVHHRSFDGASGSDKPLKDAGDLYMDTTAKSGLGSPHNNMPPYKAAIYIIKL